MSSPNCKGSPDISIIIMRIPYSITHHPLNSFFFFLKDPATPEFSPLPLPAALPIWGLARLSLYHAWADVLAGRLVPVLEEFNTGDLEPIHAVYLGKPDRLPPRTRAVLDFLQAHRSEEHTSELQSPCNLVCRLLLEKK